MFGHFGRFCFCGLLMSSGAAHAPSTASNSKLWRLLADSDVMIINPQGVLRWPTPGFIRLHVSSRMMSSHVCVLISQQAVMSALELWHAFVTISFVFCSQLSGIHGEAAPLCSSAADFKTVTCFGHYHAISESVSCFPGQCATLSQGWSGSRFIMHGCEPYGMIALVGEGTGRRAATRRGQGYPSMSFLFDVSSKSFNMIWCRVMHEDRWAAHVSPLAEVSIQASGSACRSVGSVKRLTWLSGSGRSKAGYLTHSRLKPQPSSSCKVESEHPMVPLTCDSARSNAEQLLSIRS